MVDSFYIVRLGEQGEWRQADGNFNIYTERREKGGGHTTLSLLTAILGLVVAKQL